MNGMRRDVLIAAAAVVYVVGLWPTWWVRDLVLRTFNHPPYQGLWILVPHVFLYATLQALCGLALWTALARLEWMPVRAVAPRLRALGWGVAVGLLSSALVVGFLVATGQADAFHPPRVDPWLATANVFSNVYEEYVFRGFILTALTAALGFWPAAILSSVAFGATHTQYPLTLQLLIAAIAVLWAWAGNRSGGLLTSYAAHMTLDWLLDPVL
jgi:membrane protease YdiL (CAAX protease family)